MGSLGLVGALFDRPAAEIAPGAVHIPAWLSIAEQHALVDLYRQWAAGPVPPRAARMPFGRLMSVQTMCVGWHWQPYRYSRTADDVNGRPVLPFPDELTELARRALTDAYGSAPPDYQADAALLNLYEGDAKMGMHQDKDEVSMAPIVSVSIGDACLFRFGNTQTRNRPYDDVRLESGDLFVFGGPSRMAFHAVPRTYTGTAPDGCGLRSGRLNITIRDTGIADAD